MTRPLPRPTGDPQVDAANADQSQLDAANAAAGNPTPPAPPNDPGLPTPPPPPAPSTLSPTDQATQNDDWTKMASWDVTDAAGEPVTTLDALAEVLDTDRTTAAGVLLGSPMAAAAPPELIDEANAEINPQGGSLYDEFADETGAGTGADTESAAEDTGEPAEEPADAPVDTNTDTLDTEDQQQGKSLAAGMFVAFAGAVGKVELVVSNGGTVPGVDETRVGTKDHPAARVRVYRQAAGRWLPTGQRIAVDAMSAKSIRDLDRPAAVQTKDATGRLVLLVAEHAGAAGSGRPTAEAIREVYRRGQESWPGERKTLLSRQEWALGRASAFVDKAEGYATHADYVGDDDLLP